MSRRIYDGCIVSLETDRRTLPNGEVMEVEIVRHPGGAAVVAVDAAGAVCLLRQYRPALERWLWELPAGKIDHGEPPAGTARRELAEETGMRARHWRPLGAVVSSPGVFTEVVHLYLATELTPGRTRVDAHEVFEVHWVPFAEALERARGGDIDDAKTVAGLFRAAVHLS